MRTFFFLLLLLLCCQIKAQEVIATGGDFYSQTNGSISYTIGETVVETYSNSGILTQGFQQDYENILSIEPITNQDNYLVYPNPFSASFQIQAPEKLIGGLTIQLEDQQGKLLLEEKFIPTASNLPIQINVSHLANGIYYLKIHSEQKEGSACIKLLKNH